MNTHYTTDRSTQMVLSVLKAYGIKKIVASPGTTNMAFVASAQSDPHFEMYSSVDERSAAYIACGLSQESGEAVVISCTGATASRDYMPGLTEAYYRKLPILAITGSHGEYLIGHLHPQVIDRSVTPNDIVRYSANIKETKCSEDEWHNNVEINKAVSELFRHGGGPVHINLETMHNGNFACEELPPCRVIKRITSVSGIPSIPNGKIAIVIGSHRHFSQDKSDLIDKFCSEYNAVVFADHTSNYYGKYSFKSPLLGCQFHYNSPIFNVDLVIHIGEVSADVYSYSKLKSSRTWRISEDGEMRDRFRNLEYVFEMSVEQFMEVIPKGNGINTFYDECCREYKMMFSRIPEIPFSNIWIANTLHDKMPGGCMLYFSILNSLRAWNFFNLSGSIITSCNVGGFGIDGPLSTALGAAIACPDRTVFVVTGDLAFFYDLNVLGNRHIGSNIRILLINNGCGTEFRNYDHPASYWGKEANLYMAAGGHFGKQSKKLVKDFVSDLGFEYLSASTKEDFIEVYPRWTVTTSDKPIVLEVFTNSDDESVALDRFRNIVPPPKGQQIKERMKSKVKELIGNDALSQVKKILNK